jgi:hypothetical protein
MRIQGKVVAKIQQEGGASLARIQVYKKKKTAAALMRIFDIVDDGELNIGDQVVVEVYRKVIKAYEPPFETVKAPRDLHEAAFLAPSVQEHDVIMREITHA